MLAAIADELPYDLAASSICVSSPEPADDADRKIAKADLARSAAGEGIAMKLTRIGGGTFRPAISPRSTWSRSWRVQPVGAVEQHGPHLPVRVDAAINAGIVARAVELMPDDLPVLVLPMMPVGKSNEHLAFPGTLSLQLRDARPDVVRDRRERASRRLAASSSIFNSHGGQPQVMDIVCRELRVKLGMFAVGCSWFRTIDDRTTCSARRAEARHPWRRGRDQRDAASPSATSSTWATPPNFVPLSVELERGGGMLTPEGAVGFGWQAQDLEPSGACGNAAAADAERGAILVERAAAGAGPALRRGRGAFRSTGRAEDAAQPPMPGVVGHVEPHLTPPTAYAGRPAMTVTPQSPHPRPRRA